MSDKDIINIHKKIISNHYLSNCYQCLIRLKAIHFFLILIELLLNTFQLLDIVQRDYMPINKEETINALNYIHYINIEFNTLSNSKKLIIIFLFTLIFDLLYIFIKRNNFKKKRIYILIIINILELFYFRTTQLILLNLLFSFKNNYLLISFLIFLPHIYLIIDNFLNNHLYYFSPEFIKYPYDEFTSFYDITLFISKIFLGIANTISNIYLLKLIFIFQFAIQILFSTFFIYKLIYHSYLFMINSFLNKTRFCLYIIHTNVIIMSLINEKNEIKNILFSIINIGLLLVVMGYLYFLYDPYEYITIKMETPLENIIFYLFVKSNKNFVDYVYESKVNEHYEKCGVCTLCIRYNYYLRKIKSKKEANNEENQSLINEKKKDYSYVNDIEGKKKEDLIDLFNILYDLKSKYFILIKKLITNYKTKGKESFINNANYYYVNLSYLIYSEFNANNTNNITLLLNQKLLLEIINQNNNLILDNDQSQIMQLLLFNKFINISDKIIIQFKDIMNCKHNLQKAKKLIDLSHILIEMKNKKFKKYLFDSTQEHNFISKNMLTVCSIFYEEIFNTSISNSNAPLRDNIQYMEDNFLHNKNKNDNIISLSFNLNNENCKIIRVGKDLSWLLNKNLFDIFPLIFKQYQKNLFLLSILNKFDANELNNQIKINEIFNDKTKSDQINKIKINNIKSKIPKNTTQKKSERKYIEINLIICQTISSKVYYKLLTLKLTPLFSNDNNYFILFNGFYYLNKYMIMTSINHDNKTDKDIKENLLLTSSPELEKNDKETYNIKLANYNKWLNEQGFKPSKLTTFNISYKTYIIYVLNRYEKPIQLKIEKKNILKNEKKNESSMDEKLNLIEDNKSVTSQTTTNSSIKGNLGVGIRNTKKDMNDFDYLNQIKMIIFLTIIIIIILIIFEFIHLNSSSAKISNFNDVFIKFRKFSKFYYQIFPLTLSTACINYDENNCQNIISYYSDIYFKEYPKEKFNVTLLLLIHIQRINDKMMEKKGYTDEIYELIGPQKYNEIFGSIINYSYVIQNFDNKDTKYEIISVEKKFSEALLIMCNSFNSLNKDNNLNDIIYFLNKTEHSFSYLNGQESKKELTNCQREIYEIILNYRMYSSQLDKIINILQNLLEETGNINKIYIYIYFHLDILLVLLVLFLIYLYLYSCEKNIIRILNFINMIINIETTDFKFKELFIKKLENLEILLDLNKSDPIKAIQNLKKIYNIYHHYLVKKNKLENKRENQKGFLDKNIENDNIPSSQILISKKEFSQLNIKNKYYIIFFSIILIILVLYIFLLILWIKYFEIETNLYILVEKDTELESSIYRGINLYYLMIFSNFTINEVARIYYPNIIYPDEDFNLLKSFYDNLQYAFSIQKQKDELGKLYNEEELLDFSCENLYELNKKIIKELGKTTLGPELSSIKKKLIKICENLGIAQTNDTKTELERHIQLINNGMISLNDFTLKGINKHLKTGNLGKITLLFNNILVYLMEAYIIQPDKATINGVSEILQRNIKIIVISFIVINIIIIIIILYIIYKIEKYSSQILILKIVFKLVDYQ